MPDIEAEVDKIHDDLPDGADVDRSTTREHIETYLDYNVRLEEAVRQAREKAFSAAGVDDDDDTNDDQINLGEIDSPEEWGTVEVTVVTAGEADSDAVAQTGLVGDPTGTVGFTAWAKSNVQELVEGQSYRLENVVTDEYQGRYSIKLNAQTEVTELDRSIEVTDQTTEMDGLLVDIQDGSGLIKRCPQSDCTRVLQNGRCSEHGDVEGEFDMRIKAVIDDGDETQQVIFDAEQTEALTGMSLEDAKQAAQEALDLTIVAKELEDQLYGVPLRVEGEQVGQYLLATNHERRDTPTSDTIEDMLITARSMNP